MDRVDAQGPGNGLLTAELVHAKVWKAGPPTMCVMGRVTDLGGGLFRHHEVLDTRRQFRLARTLGVLWRGNGRGGSQELIQGREGLGDKEFLVSML